MTHLGDKEDGFTLIELLIVVLIIGILAAIAIPSFLNQREKGQDACAKSMSRGMATAMETYYTENSTYVGASLTALQQIEATITANACGSGTNPVLSDAALDGSCNTASAPGARTYCVGYESAATDSSGDPHVFSTAKTASGTTVRLCSDPGSGGCPASGTW